MPSPFPGMDPYLESQGYWQDFHTSFLTYLPPSPYRGLARHYGAFIEERIDLVDFSAKGHSSTNPMLSITPEGRGSNLPAAVGSGNSGTDHDSPGPRGSRRDSRSGGSRSSGFRIGPW